MPTLRLPALTDAHVHLRDLGETHKEDFASGTAAALAGGVTTVLAMPNTKPPVIDSAVFDSAAASVQRQARADVGLFVGAAAGNAQAAAALADHAVGLKIYLDATYGPLRVNDWTSLLAHFRTWPRGRVIAVHAEELSIPVAVGLAWAYGQRLHLCHVSRREELAYIQAAKAQGAPITCEVTPHHLFLDETDLPRLGARGQMRPPLATPDDRAGLWEMLDVVDCIATDHAPHTLAEKSSDAPPPGIPGLETTLPLLLTAVAEGRLTLDRLVALTHTHPRQIFRLPEQPDTYIEIDPDARWTLPDSGWHTRPGWSAFAGRPAQGRLRRVVLRGQTAFEDGVVLAAPGSGRLISPL